VSDGHGNAAIHCFSPEGELRFSWGAFGEGPGEFKMVHSIFIDHDDHDRIYVTDRFNNRIQFFRPTGEYLGQWTDIRMPQSVRKGPDGAFYVAQLAHQITVLRKDGTAIARWGARTGVADAQLGSGKVAFATAPSRDPVVKDRVVTSRDRGSSVLHTALRSIPRAASTSPKPRSRGAGWIGEAEASRNSCAGSPSHQPAQALA
jgi:hypothetical protein